MYQALGSVRGASAAPASAPSCIVSKLKNDVGLATNVQSLGATFSSLNGNSMRDAVGIGSRSDSAAAAESRRLQVHARRRGGRIQNTATITTVPQTVVIPPKKTVDQGITFVGKIKLSRTIGLTEDPPRTRFHQFQRNISFSLFSSELKRDGALKRSARTQMQDDGDDDSATYDISFTVPADFGDPGALIVESRNEEEFYLELLVLEIPEKNKRWEFACNSWINKVCNDPYQITGTELLQYFENELFQIGGIFFTNQVYLPDSTPLGLKFLRELQLRSLRGDGTGERKQTENIYDYDVYNDLGKSSHPALVRPTLGGSRKLPYPRRCRTGRHVHHETGIEDPIMVDGKDLPNYVPRDEDFSRVKETGFRGNSLTAFTAQLLPLLRAKFDETPDDFDTFLEVFDIFKSGLSILPQDSHLQPSESDIKAARNFLEDHLFRNIPGAPTVESGLDVVKFPIPQVIADDQMLWMSDEEFGRQTIAGFHPVTIQRATEFPPKSSLDPAEFGQATSLTAKLIEPFLISEGQPLTVAKAILQKRLFTIDYHDVFLPFINDINSLPDTKRSMYAGRAFFFLTDDKKMKPVAIELSLPPPRRGEHVGSNRAFTPPLPGVAQKDFLWELAKLHFKSIDFGFHELVSHWFRAHAIMEPFVIASRRQLSAMHPVLVLLEPCFMNTMRINANARQNLINAGGTIETNFTPGAYSVPLTSVYYDKLWQFDRQALPKDLLARGMAEEDKSREGGVKLLFEDYPYAKDALDVWNATHSFITDYVKKFYQSNDKVVQDEELQLWWKEVREEGHPDKKDESWWPKLNSVESLIEVLATIAWIAGPHHASVNFGQYGYAGFSLNYPSITRRLVPEENTPEHNEMLFNSERFILTTTGSPYQSITVMTTLMVLSNHAKDEEYIGQRLNENWTSDPEIMITFQRYARRVRRLELMFKQRNHDPTLPNRRGALATPGYSLLYPTSEPGITGKGIPWSVSI